MSEREQKQNPILGDTHYSRKTCGYGGFDLGSTGFCEKDATFHIIWEGRTHSLVCDEHKDRAEAKRYEQIHPKVEFCDDPRAMWFPEEETCRIPTSPADFVVGIFLLD